MKYGLIASAVGHSFSAEIHKALFGYDYELKALKENELAEFLNAREFSAINVTIPYKERVIEHLDYVDQMAKNIGAVNTVVNVDGKLYGYNTDFDGMSALLKHENIDLTEKKVLILGSGGTSKTAYHVSLSLGCKIAFRVSRSEKDGCITYENAIEKHNDAEIIINTTPVGMFPDISASAIDINAFPNLCAVVDVVYNPLAPKLVTDARAKGVKAVGGLYMLVAQAAYAAEKFVNKSVPSERIDRIYKSLFASKQNLVLIGMPGCGKTTIGKELAKKMCFEFIDSDEEIFKALNKTPSQIINESGENAFRDIEASVILKLSAKQGCVIATGGGAILRKENVERLKYNGKLFFLDRDINKILPTEDRPLSNDRESLINRFNERYDIYLASCDVHINCDDDIQANVNEIIKEI